MIARRALVTVLVTVLVTTAGCSGLVGDSPEADADTEAAPADDPTPAAGDRTEVTDDGNDSDGAAGSAALDADAVAAAHADALEAAGSFNATRTLSLSTNDTSSAMESFSLTTRYSVDHDRNRAVDRSSFFGETVTFTDANGTTYERTSLSAGGEAGYRMSDASDDGPFALDPVNVTEATGTDAFAVENVSYRGVGTETGDGATVTRYEANGTEALRGTAIAANGTVEGENTTITAFEATLLIDEAGVVRLSEWRIEFVDRTNATSYALSTRHEVSAVGEAAVERPDWLSAARNASTSAGMGTGNCSAPAADGEFTETVADDGYNVTFAATSLADRSVVRLEYGAADYSTLLERTAYFEGDTAEATNPPAGTTVEAVAENDCGERAVVATRTAG